MIQIKAASSTYASFGPVGDFISQMRENGHDAGRRLRQKMP